MYTSYKEHACVVPFFLSNTGLTTAVKILPFFSIPIPDEIQIQKSSLCNSLCLPLLSTSLPTFEMLSFNIIETPYKKWRNSDKTQDCDADAVRAKSSDQFQDPRYLHKGMFKGLLKKQII
ncbi:hypothetical protein QL285_038973 [Trifolium repens]|nr:hypothetical protein QL285_038973 [Trifolium repens]